MVEGWQVSETSHAGCRILRQAKMTRWQTALSGQKKGATVAKKKSLQDKCHLSLDQRELLWIAVNVMSG